MDADTTCANCGKPINSLNAVEIFTGALICEECRDMAFADYEEEDQEAIEKPVYWMVCPICDAGLNPDTTYQTSCDVCKGTGYIEVPEDPADA